MRLILYTSFLFCAKVSSFNFDMDFPIVFRDWSNVNKTYFGYTVSMYHEQIMIGAPRANDSRYPNIDRPGTAYECYPKMGCKSIEFPHSTERPREEWRHGFVGGTMDISYRQSRIAVCGYRQYYVINGDYRTMGSCFWSFLNKTEFKNIKPLLDTGKGTFYYPNVGSVYLFGQSQAGFSAHFPEREKELILGAPGTFNWAGTPLKVYDLEYDNPEPSRRRRQIDPKRSRRELEPFKNVEVPDSTKNEAFNLFGYSVSSGYYYGKNILYYASGTPKSSVYKGKVVIFRFNGPYTQIRASERKIGEEFGEYFGASLASGDINGDMFDDLLVGAPFYKGSTYNEGRVFIFHGDTSNLQMPSVLTGNGKNGQFGTSIMYLGDIDNDGFGDVAISAPYENDNTGTVYIYKGAQDGLLAKPCQIIQGRDVSPVLQGFGITISKAVDIDGNRYKDMSIGSHVSGHSVLFRGKPIVVIKYTMESIPKILPEYFRAFMINVCFSYKLFVEDSVDISYTIKVDETLRRATIGSNNSISTNVTLYQNLPACQNISVTISDSIDLDIKIPIQASLSYKLNYPKKIKALTFVSGTVEEDKDDFCGRCPILDTYKSNQTVFETEIPFSLDCGSDNECQSLLDVDIKFPQLRDNTLVIGSTKYVKMEITVSNRGENAFSTELFVVLPPVIFFRQAPEKCTSINASAIFCNIENPLRNNSMKSREFDIDVTFLNNKYYIDDLEIYSKIITKSENLNNDTHLTTMYLKREADITIYGNGVQGTNYYGNNSESISLLTHTYNIEKFGHSPLEKLVVSLQVPHEYQIKGKQPVRFLRIAPVDVIFSGQPFKCNLIGTEEEATTEKVVIDADSIVKSKRRRRRQVETFQEFSPSRKHEDIMVDNEEVEVIANRTLFLNCSSEDVNCFQVVCSFGPYYEQNTPASISLRMMVNITEIAELAKTNDMVLIATSGSVKIEYPVNFTQYQDRPDVYSVQNVFINDISKPVKVALWVIIVSIIIGILLLLLLIFILLKIGFFKRSKKEELENLKAAADQEDKILEIIEGSKMEDEEMETKFDSEMNGEEVKENKPNPNPSNSSKENLVDT